MSDWIDRFSNHQIHSELVSLDQALEAIREAVKDDPIAFDAWQRIGRVSKFAQAYLGDLDPMLVSLALVDAIQAQIRQVVQMMYSFASSPTQSYLLEANKALDNALTNLGNIPSRDHTKSVGEFSKASQEFRKTIGNLTKSLQDDVKKVKAENDLLGGRIAELTAEVASQKQRADDVIAQMQLQFSNAQEARLAEAVASESKRAAEFLEAEQERKEDNEKFVTAANEAFHNLTVGSSKAHLDMSTELEGRATLLLDKIDKQKTSAERVVGIITTEAVAHGFGKTANEERDAAKIWRWVAVGALVVWILAGLVFFALTFDKELSATAVVRQFLISTPFVLLAGFAAIQVRSHQRSERVSRQAELEIASIDPYLASFDDTARNEVKKQLAEKLFGNRDAEGAKVDGKDQPGNTVEVLKIMQDIVTAIKK